MPSPLLEIQGLKTHFFTEDGVVKAVDGNSLHLDEQETLGIVGESGSGKTITALSVMGLIENPGRIVEGRIFYKGEDLTLKPESQMRRLRGNEISMVFQDSLSSLNPTMTVGDQIDRVLSAHARLPKKEKKARILTLMEQLKIPEPGKRISNYPHEFSGGMRQRILIAMAIACNPSILILDEPTTALDVTIEAQIFELVEQLKADFRMGTLLITHDLSVVAGSCNRVIIMYAGRIVEEAPVAQLFESPLHPYTMGLLKSIPRQDQEPRTPLFSIPGEVPDLVNLNAGCTFSSRCIHAAPECDRIDPELVDIAPGRRAACIRLEEIHARDLD